MRLPIHDKDLDIKGGFKRIAKRLQRSCPESNPLKHTKSMEILAQAFGYRNFHDIHRSTQLSVAWHDTDLKLLKQRLIMLVTVHSKGEALPSEAISEMVEGLPWHSLMALRQSATGTLSDDAYSDEVQTANREEPSQPSMSPEESIRSNPVIIVKRSRSLTRFS